MNVTWASRGSISTVIVTIVVAIFIALGCIGYFVVYPNIAKSLVKPRVVYETIINNLNFEDEQEYLDEDYSEGYTEDEKVPAE